MKKLPEWKKQAGLEAMMLWRDEKERMGEGMREEIYNRPEDDMDRLLFFPHNPHQPATKSYCNKNCRAESGDVRSRGLC